MSETPTRGFSPTGYILFGVLILAILFAVFIISQRGGEVDGQAGTTEVDAPTQIEPEDVQ